MSLSFRTGPAENEIECALCGALFSYELTRCPNCGASLYAVEVSEQEPDNGRLGQGGLLNSLRHAVHSLFQIPYSAEEVFGDPLDLAALYDVLTEKLGGDRAAADRLVDFEHRLLPSATRVACIRNAIQRLQADDDHSEPTS